MCGLLTAKSRVKNVPLDEHTGREQTKAVSMCVYIFILRIFGPVSAWQSCASYVHRERIHTVERLLASTKDRTARFDWVTVVVVSCQKQMYNVRQRARTGNMHCQNSGSFCVQESWELWRTEWNGPLSRGMTKF